MEFVQVFLNLEKFVFDKSLSTACYRRDLSGEAPLDKYFGILKNESWRLYEVF
jgi:hypothetical protein